MKFHRIWAVVLHYLYTQKRSVPRTMDILYWPILNILLWGFLSLYLVKAQQGVPNIVGMLLGALVLWLIFNRAQQDVTIHFLEDIWNRNLLNLFVSPLSMNEYLAGFIILSLAKVAIVSTVMVLFSLLVYHFNLFSLGFALIPFLINLLLFGWIVGLFIMTLIMRWGTDAQILAFSFTFLIQPFSAVFYPITILPVGAQFIGWMLPSTYVFEGMRGVLLHRVLDWHSVWFAFGLNILYFFLALIFFRAMLRKVLDNGLLPKLE